jgi:hypothetical protein
MDGIVAKGRTVGRGLAHITDAKRQGRAMFALAIIEDVEQVWHDLKHTVVRYGEEVAHYPDFFLKTAGVKMSISRSSGSPELIIYRWDLKAGKETSLLSALTASDR